MSRKKGSKNKKAKEHIRPSWDEYFMEIMDAVSKRSTCDRGRSACILVRGKQIISTGFAGAPKGVPHCDEVGHELHEVIHEDGTKTTHCIRTTHAEQNALAQAAKTGVFVDGSTAYVNMEPCYICAKMLVNSGINKVICRKKYHAGAQTRKLFKRAKVKLVVLKKGFEKYA